MLLLTALIATSLMKSRKFSSLFLMSSNPIPLDAHERPILANNRQ